MASSSELAPSPPATLRRRVPGALALFLGTLGFLAVLCLRWPAVLTTPELRAVYPMTLVRATIAWGLTVAIAVGSIALLAGAGRRLGAAGLALGLAGVALGGARVPVVEPVATSDHLGLDWFVLDLFLLALVFVPLERAFAHVPEQRILRTGWRTDTAHFFVSHVGMQLFTFLIMAPAVVLFRVVSWPDVQDAVAAQPLALQFVEALVVADLGAWLAHRAFHAVPALWRFHAIHHSSEAMDWLAGSRMHVVDVVVTRAAAFCPLLLLGFSRDALSAYLVWVALQATLIHANVRWTFGPLRWLVVGPQYHHWHHAADAEGLDKNFAVHLPLIDLLFGTLHLPGDRWPARYGIRGDPVPPGYFPQLWWPLR
ncbi:MAG TPA: sterol desaturase family protein [Candidatus Bathyarchaeia archaeon]|nr:sterol desaturase family protein [Candidatus Bathyarchaeia archaeon]